MNLLKFKPRKSGNSFMPTEQEIRKTLHKNLEFTATEQYKLIRANLDFTLPENEKCPVIGVTSSMRGQEHHGGEPGLCVRRKGPQGVADRR